MTMLPQTAPISKVGMMVKQSDRHNSKQRFFLPGSEIEIVAPKDRLDFLDSQSQTLSTTLSPLQVWNRMMANSLPGLKTAFQIRDAISAQFGVKRIGGLTSRPREQVAVGDMLDFFLVEDATEDRLSLTERDKHLDTMTCITVEDRVVTITSSVITHNLFGKVYMIPVAPAHKLIVHTMLRRLISRKEPISQSTE